MYNIKHRLFAFLGFLFFISLSFFISFLAFETIIEYFTNAPVIVYSMWAFFSVLIPLVTVPFLLMIVPVFFYGRQVSVEFGKKLMLFSLWSLVVIFISTFACSFAYKKHLDVQGYIQCRGIPSGWMPGMATKYVLNESLCHKRR